MADEPLIVREKDYEGMIKLRRLKLAPSNFNPLSNNLQDRKQKNTLNKLTKMFNTQKKGKPAEETTTKTSNNPLAGKPKNPLAQIKPKNPLEGNNNVKKPEQAKETISKKDNDQNEKNEDAGADEFKEQAQPKGNEILGFWEEIRAEFVKNFEIRTLSPKMDLLVSNPFGNQAQTNEDRAILRSVQTQQGKLQYGAANVQPETQKPNTNKITIKTFLGHVQGRYQDMQDCWDKGNKVGTLQITIQQIKLLIDNEEPRFAPIKWVYIMDILEKFRGLIFMRMKKLSFPNKTDEELQNLPLSHIIGANIPESAQEISRNWIKKVGSIRELIPRIYIECALLPVYYFFDHQKIKPILNRLTRSSRALGDYINSLYFSIFAMRIGAELLPKEKQHILMLLSDFFFYMKQGQSFFGKQGMSTSDFMALFQPFLVTAFKYYSNNCSDQDFYDLYELFKASNQHTEVLRRIIETFPANFISTYSGDIFMVIQNYHVDMKAGIYTIFLPKILQGMQNRQALTDICNLVWLDLAQVTKFELFLSILASLIELVQKAFIGIEKQQMFSNILDKFNSLFQQLDLKGDQEKKIFDELEIFVKKILTSADDVSEIISMEPFLQFIHYFPVDRQAKVSPQILQIFLEKDKNDKIRDPIKVHSLLQIANSANDPHALAAESNAAELVSIMTRLIHKIDFGKDLESMLNVYTTIRANFGNYVDIIQILIYKVIDLTFKARNLSKNKISNKIKSFLQASVAFCYITIPMVENPLKQLQFYITCSQIALLHNLISQAEAIFMSGLSVLGEMPEVIEGKNTDEQSQKLLKTMVAEMLVLPDDPNQPEYLNLFTNFYQIVDTFKWSKKNGEIYKMSLMIDLVKYLCVQIQEKLPYHIEGVVSNDFLFSDPEFKQKIVEKIDNVLTNISKAQQEMLNRTVGDVYTYSNTINICCQSVNTLLQYFKPNQRINTILKIYLQIILKRVQDLSKDKIGKLQVKQTGALINNTFQNIEKNAQEIQEYNYIKENITKLIEGAQNII